MLDAHYVHPRLAELYDHDNPWAADTDFYVWLAGERPRSVLDLGCGTGTLACALAASGHRVTGVDPAAAMLAVARRKPAADRVEWVESSAQRFETDRRFDRIVMTGHAFQVLMTDDDTRSMLQRAERHLARGGLLAFESRNPEIDWVREWSGRPDATWTFGPTLVQRSLEVVGRDGWHLSFVQRYVVEGTTLSSRSTLRFAPLGHLVALLEASGLSVRDVYGGWDRSPFEPARSREMIFVAQRPPP